MRFRNIHKLVAKSGGTDLGGARASGPRLRYRRVSQTVRSQMKCSKLSEAIGYVTVTSSSPYENAEQIGRATRPRRSRHCAGLNRNLCWLFLPVRISNRAAYVRSLGGDKAAWTASCVCSRI